MAEDDTGLLEAFERWRATAFLVAGAMFVPFVAANGLVAFTSVEPPRLLVGLFILGGVYPSYVGLFGLYPQLSERVPRQALAGAAAVSVASVTLLLMYAGDVGAALGGLPMVVSGVLWLLTVLLTIVGFVLFGTACLRADVPSRTVGVALLAPPAIYGTMLVSFFAAGMAPPEWSTFAISAVQLTAHLAVGVVLGNGPAPDSRAGPAVEPTEG